MTIVLFVERFFYRCFNYLWRRYLLSSAKGNAAVVAAANDGKTKRAPRPDQDHGDGEDGEGGDVGEDDGVDGDNGSIDANDVKTLKEQLPQPLLVWSPSAPEKTKNWKIMQDMFSF